MSLNLPSLSDAFFIGNGIALVVPITSKKKDYPFEVKIVSEKVRGFALADAIKNLDWQERNAEFAGITSKEELFDTLKLLSILLKP